RTDALGLIGNRVFGPLNNENQSMIDAPVNFPHLWDTAWFDWVQYNASIRMPLARNIGEALGVGGAVKLGNSLSDQLEYTVRVDNLDWIERFLGGDDPMPSYTDEYAKYENVNGSRKPKKQSEKVRGLLPPSWDDFAAQVEKAAEVAGNKTKIP